ncbi:MULTISPECIES: NAD(P)-binding domain-containing protein [unclassified Arthrobacter]|uniref:flavin-containing monooxygenase n=1 Tax=unclassified Arthrobacter TaxID=235627 RepID=UPI0024DFA6B6|nr:MULTISPECIES: NAD(P)-binding domain-containing protein [unclassified Arthrobacter]MCC9145509.1 NAD(P)-binding domain-containing protein [Arthrobacter sp. zg-Y919]MDK1276737.1 NAD(P)-binding domain-containing protein [Arthrobacter sp. zg.Y919]WIB04319.1 NAD(P)-binding domain-containing protein [Arthrobacter sp. zg-Y919]
MSPEINSERTDFPVAVIGSGPSGLAAMRALSRQGLDFVGFEQHSDVGGLWNIGNPASTVYESAHLISSKSTTQFAEFPMPEDTPDYPGHRHLQAYFRSYADHFHLRPSIRFGVRVAAAVPSCDGTWTVSWDGADGPGSGRFSAVIVASGTLHTPALPDLPGQFDGEIRHTASYKDPRELAGKRVLIVGAGNSGCDIAVDAVHHAAAVDISVRRGYYFVPKYVFGRPTDTLNQGRPMPRPLKQFFDKRLLRMFTGDPHRFGFPKPDYRIYESHPVVNSLILHHLGHGDLQVRGDIARLDGHTVSFRDGTAGEYDLILLATGYVLDYPFLDRALLGWDGPSPSLYLNIFSRQAENLLVVGMVEASGLGWEGRFRQAELAAAYLAAQKHSPAAAGEFRELLAGKSPDVTGGYRYLGLDRMSYYVNKDAYRAELEAHLDLLSTGAAKTRKKVDR